MTAEAAVVVPLLASLALGLGWLVGVGAAQVRVVDAAREAVRVAARGESEAAAVAAGRQVAPPGTRFAVRRGGGQVQVTATARVDVPGGLLGRLPGITVRSEATAVAEPQGAGP